MVTYRRAKFDRIVSQTDVVHFMYAMRFHEDVQIKMRATIEELHLVRQRHR